MEYGTAQLTGRDDLSIRDLLNDFWKARLAVICLVTAFTVAFGLVGGVSKKQYEASVLLAPALEDSSSSGLGGLGALAARYGGLASLAGISLPGGNRREEAVAVLQSELLTTKYIRDNNLLPVLYPDRWDSESNKWLSTDPEDVPTLWKANQYFKKKIRRVTDDKKTGLVVLTIRWSDPQEAARWANDLVKRTNEYLREKAIREAESNIAYLNDQASKTNIVEAKRAIYSLLQEEINKAMLARGREEYALKVLDPASVPERPASKGAVFLAIVGFFVGCFVAIFAIFGRRILQSA